MSVLIRKFKRALRDCLFKYYIKEWNSQLIVHADKKLSCYSTFKQNFGQENYLRLLKNFEQRRSLTRFRISAHRLNIERGRYQGIPRQERYCSRCNVKSVDDEKHFLFSCHHNKALRDTLYNLANDSCKNFQYMDNDQKLNWLMMNENIQYYCLVKLSEMILKSVV